MPPSRDSVAHHEIPGLRVFTSRTVAASVDKHMGAGNRSRSPRAVDAEYRAIDFLFVVLDLAFARDAKICVLYCAPWIRSVGEDALGRVLSPAPPPLPLLSLLRFIRARDRELEVAICQDTRGDEDQHRVLGRAGVSSARTLAEVPTSAAALASLPCQQIGGAALLTPWSTTTIATHMTPSPRRRPNARPYMIGGPEAPGCETTTSPVPSPRSLRVVHELAATALSLAWYGTEPELRGRHAWLHGVVGHRVDRRIRSRPSCDGAC